jgi:hypothetical protein
MQSLNKCDIDMATAKLIKPYEGGDKEDINTWIRDVLLIAEITVSTVKQTVKMMLLSLKGAALSWAAQVLGGRTDTVSLNDLMEMLRKRFGATQITDVKLSRFLTANNPQTRAEFSEMLKDGTFIYESKLMSDRALAQMVVKKAPVEIKGLLYQAMLVGLTWDSFTQKAEEISWITFPDKILGSVEVKNNKDRFEKNTEFFKTFKHGNKKNKYCILHGEGDHVRKSVVRKMKFWKMKGKRSVMAITTCIGLKSRGGARKE